MGVAVKVILAPEQAGLAEATMLTVGVILDTTDMVILLLLAVAVD